MFDRSRVGDQPRRGLSKRQSQLIWGAEDSGKTFLIGNALVEFPEHKRQKCLCWSGPGSRREIIEHLIRPLYFAGDLLVRQKVHADGLSETTLGRWLAAQSSLRLRGILFTAAEQGEYCFFLDHSPSISHALALMLKEIMCRAKTPVYLAARGYTNAEIGFAWSLYWADEHRRSVSPGTTSRISWPRRFAASINAR